MRVQFFPVLLAATWVAGIAEKAMALDEIVTFDEDRITMTLPDGWEKSELNREAALAGFQSSDSTTSLFFRDYQEVGDVGMREVLDATVANFEKEFRFTEDGEVRQGTVKGIGEKRWPGIFTTFEAEAENDSKTFRWKFYRLIFDTGDRIVLVQATTTIPLRQSRDRQVMDAIRSLVVKQ